MFDVVDVLLRRREYGLLLLIVLIGGFVGIRDPSFLAAENLRDIVVRSAPTCIVACGVMLVIVTGEIDISVGSLMGLLAAIMGILLSSDHWEISLPVGIAVTLMMGTAIGVVTGALVTYGRVPSIIATLGLLSALRGVTTLVMRGENIDGLPEGLQALTKFGLLGLPLSVWIAAAIILISLTLIHRTALGRRLYAIGSNTHSADMLGLPKRRLKPFALAYVGFLTAVATL